MRFPRLAFRLASRLAKGAIAALVALAVVSVAAPAPLTAATPNYSIAIPGIQVVPIQLSGQYSATTVAVVRFTMPFQASMIGVTASARVSGGTSPTLTVDVQAGGSTLMTAPIAVTAGAVSQGSIATATIADEAVITIDLAITGTSPTWNDITVLLTLARR